jgi:hypothetical protein
MSASPGGTPSLSDVISGAPWMPLEEHLNTLSDRIDEAIAASHEQRRRFREELLQENPDLLAQIRKPSAGSIDAARRLMATGSVAAADGTLVQVPLVSGAKLQIGVVIVSNRGDLVHLVTRVFEHDLAVGSATAREYFTNLRKGRRVSYLVSQALMLFGERQLLMNHDADWRMIHGELVPHELRTGAGRPVQNLPPTFKLIDDYVRSQQFLAVSESSNDLDVLNAAELLQPGEYLPFRSLADKLLVFLEGDQETGQVAAKFSSSDGRRFRDFIQSVAGNVVEVLVKPGHKPFLLECHKDRVDEAVSLFFTDSLWVRGYEQGAGTFPVRAFPFHIDLADQVARTLFKGSEFRNIVEGRLVFGSFDHALSDIDPRRTR